MPDRDPSDPAAPLPVALVSRRAPNRLARGLVLTGMAAVGVGIGVAAAPRRPPQELLAQVMTLVRDRFAAGDAPDVYEAAARGLVKELNDPYSELLSPKDVEDFSRTTLGRYAGVGMEVVPVGDSVYIGEVFPGGASAGAGFRRGDRIVSIDGAPVTGVRLDSVVGRLRGTPGSAVAVELERGHRTGAIAQVASATTLRRSVVRVPAVPYLVMNRGVAYVPLPTVSATAGPDVYAALQRAMTSGARGIVLDLRGNPGGAVDQAVEIVSAFMPPNKPVLDIRERTGTTQLMTEPVARRVDLPVVVLQDGGTASAAEIVGGALQDHDRALLVGRRSYGKGIAQSVFSLDGGWALKLTTARWFTPIGRSIHRDRTAADSARRVLTDAETAVASANGGFHSAGGRALAGEGGIAPDVNVSFDTLAGADRAVARELAAGGAEANRALIRFAHALSLDVDTTFQVTPAWREALRRTLATGGAHVVVDSARWSAAAPLVNQILEQQVATFAFGPGEARRRALARDRQYMVADSLIRAAASARDLVFKTTAKRDGGV